MSVCIGKKLCRRIPYNSGGLLKIQEHSIIFFWELVWQFQILKIPYASLINSDGSNSFNFLMMALELFFAVNTIQIVCERFFDIGKHDEGVAWFLFLILTPENKPLEQCSGSCS
jgi:hypothetical protein